jgi:hypothetical protein
VAITSPENKGSGAQPPTTLAYQMIHPEGEANHQKRWELKTNPISQVGRKKYHTT